jgi:hypothetical protein
MVEKSKSILRQIHWSLLLRAAIFAAAWFFLPFWLFLLIALYLYFFPLSQGTSLAIPFLVLLLLCLILHPSILLALILGAIFFYTLLIKDLLLIDRKSAYEVLTFLLSFLLLRSFYENAGGGLTLASLTLAFLVGFIITLLVRSFISSFSEAVPERASVRKIVYWLFFILSWQLVVAGLFLPLDFIYQSAVIFLGLVTLIDLIPQYLFRELVPAKIFAVSGMVFTLLAVILASARWGL